MKFVGPSQDLLRSQAGEVKMIPNPSVMLQETRQGRTFGKPPNTILQRGMDSAPGFARCFGNRTGIVMGPLLVTALVCVRPTKNHFCGELGQAAFVPHTAAFRQQPSQRGISGKTTKTVPKSSVHMGPSLTGGCGNDPGVFPRPAFVASVIGIRPG